MDNDLIPKDGGFSSKMTVVVGSFNNAGHCLGFCAGEITMCFFHRFGVHAFRKKLIAPWNSDIQGVKAYTNLCVIKRNFGCFQTLVVVPILFFIPRIFTKGACVDGH